MAKTALFKIWIKMPEMPDEEQDWTAYDEAFDAWSDKVHAAFKAIPGYVEDEYMDWYE